MRYLLALIMLMAASAAEAKSLYVNNSVTCSDTTVAYADNTAGNPWCSLTRALRGASAAWATTSAAQAAQAGDIVYVIAGTYAAPVGPTLSSPLTNIIYNPVNSGSSGNPITIEAVGTVVLTHALTKNPLIGGADVDYIIWKGFTINEANAASTSDTGPVVFFHCDNCEAHNLVVDGNGDAADGRADNHPGIRVEGSVTVVVKNCRISNFTTSGVNASNGAGIQVYNSKGLTFEHNEISGSGAGIFFKAIGFNGPTVTESQWSDMQDVVRYNLLHDNWYGILHHRHFHTASTVYVLIYQNIVYSGVGTANACFVLQTFTVQSGQTHDGPSNGRWVNNTCYNASRGFHFVGGVTFADVSNNLLKNNLISTTTYGIQSDNGTGLPQSYELDRLEFTRNWYYSYTTFEQWGSNKTFATFQSTYTGQEADTTVGTDPQFVNAAANNFHLAGGSPALTAGRVVHSIGGNDGDTIPVGAYITGSETIGIETGTSTPTIFNPTINLRRSELEILRDDLLAFQTEQAARWTRVCAVLGRTRTTWALNMRREIPC